MQDDKWEGVNDVRLRVETEKMKNTLVVRLHGELDHHVADRLKTEIETAIEKSQCRHLILCLKGLSFMDSSGLGVILGRYNQIKAKGGKMVVCNVNPAVHRLFELSGLFKILAIEEDEQLALSSLGVVS